MTRTKVDTFRDRAEQLIRGDNDVTLEPSDWVMLLEELQQLESSLKVVERERQLLSIDRDHHQSMYEDLYSLSPFGYLTINEQGTVLKANPKTISLISPKQQRFISSSFAMYVQEHARHEWVNFLSKLPNAVQRIHCLLPLNTSYQPRYVRIESCVKESIELSSSFRLGISDVTTQVEQEQARILAESRAETLLGQSTFGYAMATPTGQIQEGNEKFNELFDLTPAQTAGRSFETLWLSMQGYSVQGRQDHSALPLPRDNQWQSYFAEHNVWEGRVKPKRGDGSFIYYVQIKRLRLPRRFGAIFMAIVQDVTDRIRTNQLKDEFSSIVSHELRTPLTSISAAIKLLYSGILGALPDKAMEMLELAIRNSTRLEYLINDMLDLGKLASENINLKLVTTQITPLLRNAIEQNQVLFDQRKVGCEFINEVGDAFVTIDTGRFHQVLTNLMSNAAKFSPEGTTILVRLTQNGRKSLAIKVEDEGPGIPESFRSHLFQKFSQAQVNASQHTSGTGLGLYISSRLITLMKGSLSYQPRPNGGSIFTCVLPEANPDNQG